MYMCMQRVCACVPVYLCEFYMCMCAARTGAEPAAYKTSARASEAVSRSYEPHVNQ